MTRWPPLVWIMVAVGSLLLLVGYNGSHLSVPALILGGLLIVGAVVIAFALAFGKWSDRPMPTGVAWMVPATLVFYALCATAGLAAGSKYAVAAFVAGQIPLTAVTLLTATTRAKTGTGEAADHRDPFPGVGVDDETPLGDTREHSRSRS
jgi:hypothetical protein